nr:hypothetical protein [Tanacetum cinerariifolium]
MHIEKNVCESLLGLLLNIPGKTKDEVNARKDMLAMGIRSELAPQETNEKKIYLPPACYTLSKAEKTSFCECLHGIKVPSGYSANIKNLVSMKDLKLLGLKSHDCHVLLTQMIPIAVRGLMPPQVRQTITKLCLFFNMIHSKVLDHEKLEELQRDTILILCQLEMYFLPSFFDVMVHLVSHIVEEIKIVGPIFLRYMYLFERYMGFLKGYVRDRYRPEGSIIQGYAAEEGEANFYPEKELEGCDKGRKNFLWSDIKAHFRLENDDVKKQTLLSCGTKWKALKTRLRVKFMLKNIYPLTKLTHIEPNVWDQLCQNENTAAKNVQAASELSQSSNEPKSEVDPLIMVLGPEHGGRTKGVGCDIGYKKGVEGYVRKKKTSKQRKDNKDIRNEARQQMKEELKS